jgi:hypothetical protein
MMVRVGLTIYLTFTTLAGPCLCCCGPARLVAFLPFGASKSKQPAATKPQQLKGCCCHHQQPAEPYREQTLPDDRAKPGCPVCPNCPCKQSGAAVILAPDAKQFSEESPRSALERSVGLVPAAHSAGLLPLEFQLFGLGENRASPFLSVHDFLATLPMLRC